MVALWKYKGRGWNRGRQVVGVIMLADTCISNVLKMVVGHASWDAKALRIESVIWDTVSRADMLMLRFLTKICSSDPESLVVRAVRLSMGNVADKMCNELETRWNQKDYVHRQSWARQVLTAGSVEIRCAAGRGQINEARDSTYDPERADSRWREDMGGCAIPKDVCAGLEC